MNAETFHAVVIGGSAGSLEALVELLPKLPDRFPLPIFVVVHLPPDKPSVLASLLDGKCAMSVREARDKEPIEPGTVYLAPPDYHLLVETDGTISLSYDEPQMFSRPSIDVLFECAADVYGAGLIGIVLSGANSDGAKGLREIEDAGGLTLVQNPAHAYSRVMPDAALEQCETARILEAGEMAKYLLTISGYDEC